MDPSTGLESIPEPRLRALVQVIQDLNSSLDLEAVLGRLLDEVIRVVGAERGIIALWDEAAKTFHTRASRVIDPEKMPAIHQIGHSALFGAYQKDRSIVVSMQDQKSDASKSMVSYGLKGVLAVPIRLREKPIGVLYADSIKNELHAGEEERAFVHALVHPAALAIENARLHTELRRHADNLVRVNSSLRRDAEASFSIDRVVGSSPRMKEIKRLLEKLRAGRTTVLIRGESGTGKEMIAKALHFGGDRKAEAFVAINCAAVPETLLEAELLGIEKDVATGVKARTGKFEDADGGTIFLDEIGDMTMNLQAKILRVLQEREFERVGGKQKVKVDVRVIAATNKNLEEAIKAGRFRDDLYYRLNVLPIQLPPLRERKEDIASLLDAFLEKYAKEHCRPRPEIAPEALAMLMAYSWPGNVRELENVVERAVLVASDDRVLPEDLMGIGAGEMGSAPAAAGGAKTYEDVLKDKQTEVQRDLVVDALRKHKGNVTQAAEELGIWRQRLHEVCRRLAIDPKGYREGASD